MVVTMTASRQICSLWEMPVATADGGAFSRSDLSTRTRNSATLAVTMANVEMPTSIVMPATIRPAEVVGEMSPYPTVVIVVVDHHSESTTVLSGCPADRNHPQGEDRQSSNTCPSHRTQDAQRLEAGNQRHCLRHHDDERRPFVPHVGVSIPGQHKFDDVVHGKRDEDDDVDDGDQRAVRCWEFAASKFQEEKRQRTDRDHDQWPVGPSAPSPQRWRCVLFIPIRHIADSTGRTSGEG